MNAINDNLEAKELAKMTEFRYKLALSLLYLGTSNNCTTSSISKELEEEEEVKISKQAIIVLSKLLPTSYESELLDKEKTINAATSPQKSKATTTSPVLQGQSHIATSPLLLVNEEEEEEHKELIDQEKIMMDWLVWFDDWSKQSIEQQEVTSWNSGVAQPTSIQEMSLIIQDLFFNWCIQLKNQHSGYNQRAIYNSLQVITDFIINMARMHHNGSRLAFQEWNSDEIIKLRNSFLTNDGDTKTLHRLLWRRKSHDSIMAYWLELLHTAARFDWSSSLDFHRIMTIDAKELESELMKDGWITCPISYLAWGQVVKERN